MFEFATAARIVFGAGCIEGLPTIVTDYGRKVLLVGGGSGERLTQLSEQLRAVGCQVVGRVVRREPTIDDVREGVELGRGEGCDVVIGVGGGSVLDTAKAIAAMLRAPGELLDYLEVVGSGRPLPATGAPCIAVPTTAGTGAEVTRNAVIDVPARRTKVSLRGPSVLPRVALVDPTLTVSMPAELTASTGFDALTQVIEPFLSVRANVLTDALAKQGIGLAAVALRRVYADGGDSDAREDMSKVSLLGGLCLANAGLGAVHGLAGPLGGVLGAPHGALCAALLANTMEANLTQAEQQEPGRRGGFVSRFQEVARLLTRQADATAEDGVAWLRDLTRDLRIARLSSYGFSREKVPDVVARAQQASSMKSNAVNLSPRALEGILLASL